MLHHVSVGVADVERSARFYDLVLAALGYKRVMEFMPFAVAYGESAPELWIGQPANQQPAAAGNGVHIALKARNKQAVHDFHEAALAAGGSDEGGPGPRPQYSPEYYGAFVRDPDGNKIEAMLMVGIDDVPATASRGGSGKRASVRKGASRGKAKARRAAVKSAGGRAKGAARGRAGARGGKGKGKGRGRARRR